MLEPMALALSLSQGGSVCLAPPHWTHTATLRPSYCPLFTHGGGSKKLKHSPKVTKLVGEKNLGSSPLISPKPYAHIYTQFTASKNLRTPGFITKCKGKAKIPDSGTADLPSESARGPTHKGPSHTSTGLSLRFPQDRG